MQPTKVFIVDDHPLVRNGLRQLIEGEPDLSVCGEADSMSEAIKLLACNSPDIAIIDLSLPDGNGLELVKRLQAEYPDIPILVSSMHDEKLFAERALRAGAKGYINKKEAAERIGQDIHDGLGQQLTGLSLMAASLKRDFTKRNLPEANQLNEIIGLLQQATDEARALSHGLAPVPITPQGLEDALRTLAEDVQSTTGVNCHFESQQPVDIEDRTIAMQFYRIAQEAVNNAVKHAQPQDITIRLKNKDPCELKISDNGSGFQVDEAMAKGFGLRIMRYRAGIVGCPLEIESTPGKGTIVRCRLEPAVP